MDTLFIEDKELDIENSTSYLGDVFNNKRDMLHSAVTEQMKQLVQLLNFSPIVKK